MELGHRLDSHVDERRCEFLADLNGRAKLPPPFENNTMVHGSRERSPWDGMGRQGNDMASGE